jgi:SAM-dependent methyltransferase
MTQTETEVARHYTTGALEARVLDAVCAAGGNPGALTVADLKAGDEFHSGGVGATDHLLGKLEIGPDTRVLDVGCGIGGTTRYILDRFGATVTGVDLTPEFIETARGLTARVGLSDRATFHVGSALEMPVPDAGFDLAVMFHVGMNIADKPALFAEVARCLAPGGRFALFDVMRGAVEDDLVFPLPWSTLPATSFVDTPQTYRDAGEAADLARLNEEDRTHAIADFFAEARRKAEADGPAPVGIHLMMGETAPQKLGNYVVNLHAGRLQPTEMIFEKQS